MQCNAMVPIANVNANAVTNANVNANDHGGLLALSVVCYGPQGRH